MLVRDVRPTTKLFLSLYTTQTSFQSCLLQNPSRKAFSCCTSATHVSSMQCQSQSRLTRKCCSQRCFLSNEKIEKVVDTCKKTTSTRWTHPDSFTERANSFGHSLTYESIYKRKEKENSEFTNRKASNGDQSTKKERNNIGSEQWQRNEVCS